MAKVAYSIKIFVLCVLLDVIAIASYIRDEIRGDYLAGIVMGGGDRSDMPFYGFKGTMGGIQLSAMFICILIATVILVNLVRDSKIGNKSRLAIPMIMFSVNAFVFLILESATGRMWPSLVGFVRTAPYKGGLEAFASNPHWGFGFEFVLLTIVILVCIAISRGISKFISKRKNNEEN